MYLSIYLSIYLPTYLSIFTGKPEKRSVRVDAARSIHSTEDMVQVQFLLGGRNPMRICSQPRRHPRRSSIQIHEVLSALYGFRELRVVLGTRILHAAAVCSVLLSLSPLECSMPIVQIASKALHDANDALLGVHCITRITRPHFDCFSDSRFGALSPTKLQVHPLKMCLSAPSPPHTPLTHFVRSKSSRRAYRLMRINFFIDAHFSIPLPIAMASNLIAIASNLPPTY